MKTIYFVRHGESESNAAGLLSGSGDDARLTTIGQAQAKQAGLGLKNKNIDLIVCSPLSRTVDTAKTIGKEIGYDSKNIVISPLFIEMSLGVYERRPLAEFESDESNGKVHKSKETNEQMFRRFKKALEWLKELPENRIVVVSHGGARRAIRCINENLHHSQMYKIGSFGNGEIYEFNL